MVDNRRAVEVEVEIKKVEVDGAELAAELHGDPADPAILLIHGAGHCRLNWPDGFVRRLVAGGRCVVRYDARDAGASTTFPVGAPPYTLPDLAEDAAALIDSLGLGRAHVLGMSQGASVGQLLALDHPDRVVTLTLASGTPGIPGQEQPDLPPVSERLAAFFAQVEQDARVEQPASAREAVVESIVEGERPFAAASRPFDEDGVRRLAARIVDHARDLAAQSTNPYLLDAGPPWRARLGAITAPTLVLHGEEDPLFPPEHGRALAAEIPGARFLALPGTGHEVFPEHTWDAVVTAVLAHTANRNDPPRPA
ncbi:alpha/beta fold hydrolase [Kitasatospora purpeofusca]|uniref:alpha/beta fold hydrolase n=1 Tax=Kitasatospora purpeofusca TaxID=67352 RepID=UPI00224F3CEA|nr:alpha/beta hydrolase [Kitasatospora purpeofusca]MCX4755525.1 alpha/beta fold hydrolase [Kitasatospora purpeofusca]WSR36606.1 alpha/beta fold hydrolase [Kitasatospora purpeofusca]WSR44888.1 alpha/beta fold hydrolase [Kitasatospora purpeofusca]